MASYRSLSLSPDADHHSTASVLAWAFAALVVYASLYPFAGWRWPGGLTPLDLVALPMPPWRDSSDIVFNLMGYVPLGLLIAVARARRRGGLLPAWGWALVLPAGLSLGLEVTQQFLPGRFPSRLDWYLNGAGALIGATLGVLVWGLGWLEGWQSARERWFIRPSAGALTLLLLWPVGLLFPTPLPLGLGLAWERVQDWLISLLVDVSWAQDWLEWVLDVPESAGRLPPLLEGLGVALGLLGPCLLAYAVTRPGARRMGMLLLLTLLGGVATTLSSAMNFGPAHALAWMTPALWPGVLLALGGAVLLLASGPHLAAALGIAALSAHAMLVAVAPADPYFSLSLHAWEQGRFIRFHGLAQWVGWFWPSAALLWLAARLMARDHHLGFD